VVENAVCEFCREGVNTYLFTCVVQFSFKTLDKDNFVMIMNDPQNTAN